MLTWNKPYFKKNCLHDLKIPQLKESSFQEAQRWEYAQALVCLSAPETQHCLDNGGQEHEKKLTFKNLPSCKADLKIPQLKESSFQEAQRWEYAQALVCLSAPETQRCLETQPSVAASRRALQYVLLQSLLYYVIGKIYARPSSDCTTLLPDLPNSCLHNFDSTRTNIDWKKLTPTYIILSWLATTNIVAKQTKQGHEEVRKNVYYVLHT